MTGRITHKELKQKVKLLEEEVVRIKHEQIEYAMVLFNVPLFVMIVDKERRVKKVSDSILRLTGRTEKEMLGLRGGEALRCVNHINNPKGCGFGIACDACLVRLTIEDTLKTGNNHFRVESKLPFIDDKLKERTLLISTAFFEQPDKQVAVYLEDITERKVAEEALRESEERFRDLTERTSDWIWEVDREGVYSYTNPKVTKLLGYEPKEVIGKKPFDFMPSEEAKRVFDIFYSIVSSRKPFDSLENINLHKDGHQVILETSGVPNFDSIGEFCGYRGIDRDITERKQSEEALMSERDKLKALLDGLAVTGIGVDIVSAEYEILQQNQTLVDRFGNIVGKKCYQEYMALEEPCSVCPMVKALKSKRLERVEVQGADKRTYEILSAPLTNPDGTINRAIEVVVDITDRKQIEEELRKAHDQLEYRVKERTKELEIKTKNLEEVNTAMKVLLNKREEDKKVLEDNVLANVKGMIEPYFKKIKKTVIDDQQKVLLNIIESNLREIISPFANTLSSKYINLTPTEIKVADFVKHGKRNKEIADLLNLSVRTIESHRDSIRKKIRIKNKKTNLRSYLLSLR